MLESFATLTGRPMIVAGGRSRFDVTRENKRSSHRGVETGHAPEGNISCELRCRTPAENNQRGSSGGRRWLRDFNSPIDFLASAINPTRAISLGSRLARPYYSSKRAHCLVHLSGKKTMESLGPLCVHIRVFVLYSYGRGNQASWMIGQDFRRGDGIDERKG